MILLNLYPYAGATYWLRRDPRPTLLDYDPQRAASGGSQTRGGTHTVTINPQGINIGLNQGRAAGAGVPTHPHVHLVPRAGGRCNFINIVGGVR